MTSTAAPLAASSISTLRMKAAAPASTPQVGCEAMSTAGSCSTSRPTMNFCRLPPERLRAAAPVPFALTLKRSMIVRAKASALPAVDEAAGRQPLAHLGREQRRSRRARGRAPRRARAAPPEWRTGRACGVAAGSEPAGGRAVDADRLARSAGDTSPISASISSIWPLPATPAMPTTSPARTSSEMLSRSVPKAWSLAIERPSSASRTVAGRRLDPLRRLQRRADHHLGEALGRLVLSASQVATTLPPRSTVAVSQSARISSSLWEM